MDARILHSYSGLSGVVNTPNCVTSSFELSAARTKTVYQDAVTKADAHASYTNPLLTLAFTGFIFASAGLAIAEVGTALTEVPNFTTLASGETWRGHDPEDGTIILEDATDTLPGGPELIATSWTMMHCPFME